MTSVAPDHTTFTSIAGNESPLSVVQGGALSRDGALWQYLTVIVTATLFILLVHFVLSGDQLVCFCEQSLAVVGSHVTRYLAHCVSVIPPLPCLAMVSSHHCRAWRWCHPTTVVPGDGDIPPLPCLAMVSSHHCPAWRWCHPTTAVPGDGDIRPLPCLAMVTREL